MTFFYENVAVFKDMNEPANFETNIPEGEWLVCDVNEWDDPPYLPSNDTHCVL